jgi:hypothetical protein
MLSHQLQDMDIARITANAKQWQRRVAGVKRA